MHADNDRTASRAFEEDQWTLAAEIFRILADPTRVGLLRALCDSPVSIPDRAGADAATPGAAGKDRTASGGASTELSVTELSAAVGKRPSAVSQHLAKLRMARLVTTRRQGTQILYQVANEHVSQLVSDALRHSEHIGAGTPAHHRSP